MKNTYSIAFFCISLIAFFACRGTRDISFLEGNEVKELETNEANETTALSPFAGKEYRTDKDYFRIIGGDNSEDLLTAKKGAMQNAKDNMSNLLHIVTKRVTEQYEYEKLGVVENKFEEPIRDVVNQSLSNAKVIDEKHIQSSNYYEYWVAIEISKETILNGINEKISKNEKLQLDFDRSLYEKLFNDEMKIFE